MSITANNVNLLVTGANNTPGTENISLVLNTSSNSMTLSASTIDSADLQDQAPLLTLLTSTASNFNLIITNSGNLVLGTATTPATITSAESVTLTVINSGTITQGNAASIINTPTLNLAVGNGSAGTQAQPLNLTSSTSTTIETAGQDVDTGSVFVSANTASVNIGNNLVGSFNLVATNANAIVNVATGMNDLNANNIAISATGTAGMINIQSATNSLQAQNDANGNGGSISLTASALIATTAGTPITLNADATNFGNGGSVAVNITSTGITTIGGSSAGNIVISAVGGPAAGAGGSASVSTAGTLYIVDDGNGNISGAIDISPTSINGNGGSVSLTANAITWLSQGSNSLNLTVNGAGGIGNGGAVAINLVNQGVNLPAAAVIGTG